MSTDNDQATVDRLCLLTYTSDQEGEPHDCVECADAARAILDAIRNGEVPIPGMVTEAVWRGAEAECDRLRAEVERLSNERERAWQCHGGAPCGVCVTCLSGDVERLKVERDRLEVLLGDIGHYLENQSAYGTQRLFDLRERIDAALAEVGK